MKDQYDKIFRSIPIKENELINEFLNETSCNVYKKGFELVKYGEYLKTINIVVEGNVRVFKEEEDKEILLYYLNNIKTCPLSLSASLDYLESPVAATVVSPEAIVVSIPIQLAKQWVIKYPSWSIYALKVYRATYLNLLENYSDFVFMHLKNRLFKYLKRRCSQTGEKEFKTSHLFLAKELGTKREVISRVLKKMENENILTLGKQSITIL